MGLQPAASWWETDVPGVKLSYELFKKRGPIPNGTYISAIGACMVWVEAVKNALNKVGYEKLDGQAIYDGYMQIKNFTAMGIFPGISYYPDDLRGTNKVKVCKFNNDGSISNVTDYFVAPHNLKLKAQEGK
jgi:hypothetical protein